MFLLRNLRASSTASKRDQVPSRPSGHAGGAVGASDGCASETLERAEEGGVAADGLPGSPQPARTMRASVRVVTYLVGRLMPLILVLRSDLCEGDPAVFIWDFRSTSPVQNDPRLRERRS